MDPHSPVFFIGTLVLGVGGLLLLLLAVNVFMGMSKRQPRCDVKNALDPLHDWVMTNQVSPLSKRKMYACRNCPCKTFHFG